MRCHVQDVMTVDPVTVTPATPLKELVDILVEQKISSVPVLGLHGRVLGLVAETDLLRKEGLKRDPDVRHSRHMTYRARRDTATAETAGELMSTHPVTARAEMTVAEAARLMDRHQVTCLPVLDDGGKLLGVVSPRELLRVFLRPDEEIQAQTMREVLVDAEGEFSYPIDDTRLPAVADLTDY
jgi:CBS domain-containing protein